MKPLKLIINSFGPYAKEEEIDFTLLENRNIFVISGPTGAGKTTIFDAISFVLFGEASGTSRESENLKSQFARDEDICSVYLEFSLRGEIYKIKRIPPQFKLSRGRMVNQKHDVSLELPNGKVISKITDVDAEIVNALGINKVQFRQIVMLPQGEFRKLLESDSKEREKIFRKIFGTEGFDKFKDILEGKEREIWQQIAKSRTAIDTLLRSIETDEYSILHNLISDDDINFHETIDELKVQIDLDIEESKRLKTIIDKLKEEIEIIKAKYIKSENDNKQIKEYELVLKRIEELSSRTEEIEEIKKQLINARSAKEVLYVKESLDNTLKNKGLREKHKDNLLIKKSHEENNLKEVELLFNEKEKEEIKREGLKNDLALLKEKKAIVETFEERKNKLISLKDNVEAVQKAKAELQESFAKDKNSKEENQLKLENILKSEKRKAELDSASEKISGELNALREEARKIRLLMISVENHKKKGENYLKLKEDYNEKYNEFLRNKDIFNANQAGLLAELLEDDAECPVCGSTSHPKKAKKVDNIFSAEELKIKEAGLTEENNTLNLLLNELTALKTKIDENCESIKEGVKKFIDFNDDIRIEELKALIMARGKEVSAKEQVVKAELESVNALINEKSKVELEINKLVDKISKLEKSIEEKNSEYTDLFGKLQGEEKSFEEIKSQIPDGIKSSEDLNLEISKKESILNKMVDELNLLTKKMQAGKTVIATLTKEVDIANEELKNISLECEDLSKKYRDELVKKGFATEDQFIKSIMPDDIFGEQEAVVEKYKEEFLSAKAKEEHLKAEIKGKTIVELEDIKNQINLKVEALNAFVQGEEAKRFRHANNSKLLAEVLRVNEKIDAIQKKYINIKQLSDASKGKNAQRISFERYVLASYFDEIISAANLRLVKMTNSRFYLKRKEDTGKGAKQEGLELEVFDEFTSKSRSVKTLSGGEGFKASLSLALGLADVIQRNAGGVSIDTMFVDEGFGTLDPESLDNAIESLVELQAGGRLVGIISHVEELKERVDAILEVKAGKEGSHAGFKIM